MPEKRTVERARKKARAGKAPTTQAGEFVREEIRILAFCDEQLRDWYSFDPGRHWKSIIVQPA